MKEQVGRREGGRASGRAGEDSLDVNLVRFAPTPSKYTPPRLHQTKMISPPEFARSKDLKGILTYHDGMLSWIWDSKVEVNVWAKSQMRGGAEKLRCKNKGG